ncbi:MAG: hypothetical protein LBM77_07685 [Spirochaetaceae bacterium]|jgi:hypothetical protein|nr:hypothetical protein [Spirochaetaceae bacterium]
MKKIFGFALCAFVLCVFALCAISCASTDSTSKASGPQPEASTGVKTAASPETGVYVGVISFASDAKDITNGPIYLDSEGYQNLISILDKDYVKTNTEGTSLYYAVHLAMADMSSDASALPGNLESANILTFTDGLDNNSTSLGLSPLEGQDFRGKQASEYLSYIKNQIADRKINGVHLTSFSAGVQGIDIRDSNSFTESLDGIASYSDDVFQLSNFSQLDAKFSEIAKELTVIDTNLTFTVFTPSYPVGTKIRMTFDVPPNGDAAAASASSRYLEGTVGLANGSYVLQDIAYAGTGSDSGASITGNLKGTEVSYVFNDFTGYNAVNDTVRQWYQQADAGAWQVNSESRLGEAAKTDIRKDSTVVYLVLDSSNSLQDSDLISIREAAKEFIETLYKGSR